MPLTVFIKDLVVAGKHGVHEREKQHHQRFKVTVELELSDAVAASSDKLEDTVDWSRARDEIIKIVGSGSYDLVERLSGEIAAKMLEDKRVAGAVVTVEKLDAFESGVPGVRLGTSRNLEATS